MNLVSTQTPGALFQQRLLEAYSKGRPYLPTLLFLFVVFCLLAMPGSAFAQDSGMPWEAPLQKIAEAMTGPWLKWVAIIAIAIGGVLFAIGELNGPFKTALQIAAGISVAIGAATFAGMVMGS